ncbi:PREDICTED: DEAD-box ATP-dependent RNA helicase 47, mitochondrial-like, partial [Amphimedon queenslandica]
MPAHSLEELTENGWGEVPNIITTVETSERMRVPDTISHEYIKCGDDNKVDVLVSHFNKVKQERGEAKALVFIHRDSSINQFMSELAQKDIKHRALYKEVMDINKYKSFLRKFKNGDIEMVIGTEETVRGLDFSFVGTLYLTEVPRDGIEYLHLAGRVGRMGREGEVVVLIGGEKQDRDAGRLER